MTGHVAEKTERQRQNPGQMADDFNGEKNWNQPPYRSDKLFDIFHAVVFDADKMGKDKHRNGTGQGRIEAGRRRIKSRNQSH